MDDDILSITEIIDDFVKERVEVMAVELVADLVVKTPKDTTLAASSWILTLDEPTDLVVGEPDITIPVEVAKGMISARQSPYGTIYIQNNQDYIGDLNRGTSKKAPKMFVETAIARAIR
jgi:hypothetical protein